MAMGVYRCSYKKATVIICLFNVLAVVYVVNALLGHSDSPSPAIPWHRRHVLGYTAQELNRIQEAHETRRRAQPHKLIERVKELQAESDDMSSGLLALMENATVDIVQRLRDIQNKTKLQALSDWRRKKREVARGRNYTDGNDMNHELAEEEVAKQVELGWLQTAEPPTSFSESEGTGELLPTVSGAEVEDGIIPGKQVPPECHAEAHTDYDGVAVRWGLTHHTESAADCCQACFDQAKSAKPGEKKCNIWVFCAAENGCYSPDIYEHKHQECWLKQSDQPALNFKGHYHEEYRQKHPNAPVVVPWVSGVISE